MMRGMVNFVTRAEKDFAWAGTGHQIKMTSTLLQSIDVPHNPYVMKMIALSLLLSAFVLTLAAQQQLASLSKPSNVVPPENAAFDWTETTFDFGVIPVSHPAIHEFSFINLGKVPLVISSVQASCGCTVTDYSKDPVQPGSTGFVKATYNAARAGVFTKTIRVNANSDSGLVTLTITGDVRE